MPCRWAIALRHGTAAKTAVALMAAALLPCGQGQVVATPLPPEMVNTECLLYQGDGCNAIKDEQTCLNSRDGRFFDMLQGRRIRSQPCVWCGGKACSESSENVCEPYQWVIGNPLVKQPVVWQAANCLDRRTISQTLANVPGRAAVQPITGTFRPVGGGQNRVCRGVSTYDDGTGMIGFGGGQQWEYSIYTASTLEQCKSFCKTSCVGVEFRAEDLYCEIWWDLVLDSQPKQGYQCFKKEMSCLTWRVHGCDSLRDEGKCLSSKDGRQTVKDKYKGIEVYGSPCAWCGGGMCHDGSTSVCEPLALLTQGKGRFFQTFYAEEDYLVANCDSGTQVGEPDRAPGLPVAPGNPALPGAAGAAATSGVAAAAGAGAAAAGAGTSAAGSPGLRGAAGPRGADGASVAAAGSSSASASSTAPASSAASAESVSGLRPGSTLPGTAGVDSGLGRGSGAAEANTDPAASSGSDGSRSGSAAGSSTGGLPSLPGVPPAGAPPGLPPLSGDASGASSSDGVGAGEAGDAFGSSRPGAPATSPSGVPLLPAGALPGGAPGVPPLSGDASDASLADGAGSGDAGSSTAGASTSGGSTLAGESPDSTGQGGVSNSPSAETSTREFAPPTGGNSASGSGTQSGGSNSMAGSSMVSEDGEETDKGDVDADAGDATPLVTGDDSDDDDVDADSEDGTKTTGSSGSADASSTGSALGVPTRGRDAAGASGAQGDSSGSVPGSAPESTQESSSEGVAVATSTAGSGAPGDSGDSSAGSATGSTQESSREVAPPAGPSTSADESSTDGSSTDGPFLAPLANPTAGAVGVASTVGVGPKDGASGSASGPSIESASGEAAGATLPVGRGGGGVTDADLAGGAGASGSDSSSRAGSFAGSASGDGEASVTSAAGSGTGNSASGSTTDAAASGSSATSVVGSSTASPSSALEPGGAFISFGGGADTGNVFWHDAAGKHPMAPGVACSTCGCTPENIQLVEKAQMDLIPLAADAFHCVALNPPAPAVPTVVPAVSHPEYGRFIRIEQGAGIASGASGTGAGAGNGSPGGASGTGDASGGGATGVAGNTGSGATSGSDTSAAGVSSDASNGGGVAADSDLDAAAGSSGQGDTLAAGTSASAPGVTSGSSSGAGAGSSKGSGAPSASGSDGQIGSDMNGMWWQDSAGAVHKVPPGYDCSVCGCATVSTVSPDHFRAMKHGADFQCNMSRKPIDKVLSASHGHSEATAKAGDTSIEAKVADPNNPKSGSSWLWMITILLILIAAAIALCFLCGGATKRGKKGAQPGLERKRTRGLDSERMSSMCGLNAASSEEDSAGEDSEDSAAESPSATSAPAPSDDSRARLLPPKGGQMVTTNRSGPAVQPPPQPASACDSGVTFTVPPPPQPAQHVSMGVPQVAEAPLTTDGTPPHPQPPQAPLFRRGVDVAPIAGVVAAGVGGATVLAADSSGSPHATAAGAPQPPQPPQAFPRALGVAPGATPGGDGGIGLGLFDILDRNHDNVLTREEFMGVASATAPAITPAPPAAGVVGGHGGPARDLFIPGPTAVAQAAPPVAVAGGPGSSPSARGMVIPGPAAVAQARVAASSVGNAAVLPPMPAAGGPSQPIARAGMPGSGGFGAIAAVPSEPVAVPSEPVAMPTEPIAGGFRPYH